MYGQSPGLKKHTEPRPLGRGYQIMASVAKHPLAYARGSDRRAGGNSPGTTGLCPEQDLSPLH